MASFFVPPGINPSLFQMTTKPEGSGSSNQNFLHPWKMNLEIGQSASIGLSGGYDRGMPLRVTSNSTNIADHPGDTRPAAAPSDRILTVSGKAQGVAMLEVKAQSGGQPWCFLQLEVKQRAGLVQGWIGPAGEPSFNQLVANHLDLLRKSASFTKMWSTILKTGYRVTILPNDISSSTHPQILNDSFLLPDGITPGRGCADTVYYNVSASGIGVQKGNEPWRTAGAPYISLGHELVHCWMDTAGISSRISSRKENRATGLGEFANAEFSENQFRRELGLLLRDKYD